MLIGLELPGSGQDRREDFCCVAAIEARAPRGVALDNGPTAVSDEAHVNDDGADTNRRPTAGGLTFTQRLGQRSSVPTSTFIIMKTRLLLLVVSLFAISLVAPTHANAAPKAVKADEDAATGRASTYGRTDWRKPVALWRVGQRATRLKPSNSLSSRRPTAISWDEILLPAALRA